MSIKKIPKINSLELHLFCVNEMFLSDRDVDLQKRDFRSLEDFGNL